MEHLDKLSLGIREQTLGEEKDCPLVASPAATGHMAFSMYTPQKTFDALQQTLVHLVPAVRQEQDPTTSESVS